ncbi:MAG: heme exporter protein CcmB [Nitrospirota bacterium]|nr:heme exporter protein CcmB [Nitrospirota bacterium]
MNGVAASPAGGGLVAAIGGVVRRDVLLAMRRRMDVLTSVVFFVIVASLFPLGVGPEMATLRIIGPGVLWVGALLASMLSLGRLFASDYADGTLEQMLVQPNPLSLLVLGKVWAHWLSTGLPLVVLAPVLGLQYGLGLDTLGILVVSLLLGTPALSLVGAVGAALTLGLRGGGVLLALLVLPLYIPVLIFGAGAVEAHISGLGAGGHLALMGAFLVASSVLSPWAAAAALRISLD